MGIQHSLAKMTARSPSLELGTGGIPELTAADVAAAMGYVNGRIPAARVGIHLVMAKYTDDVVSIYTLEKTIAKIAWVSWFEMAIDVSVKRQQIVQLARIALLDFCEPGKMKDATATNLAKSVGVDSRTWGKGLSKVYAEIIGLMRRYEEPVLRIVYQALTKNC